MTILFNFLIVLVLFVLLLGLLFMFCLYVALWLEHVIIPEGSHYRELFMRGKGQKNDK